MKGVKMEDPQVKECEHDNDNNNNTHEETHMEESEQNNKDMEVAPALISLHPTQNSVAVAVGSDLRVFNLIEDCAVALVDESSGAFHNDSIRCIKYGANGRLFVSAGDDKLVKVWSTESWRCIATVCSEKRVTAVSISNDGLYVCFADKFGVVWVVDLPGVDGTEAPVNKKAVPLLGHYCSIITGLEFSPDGNFVVSADRDFKIRVTVFPKKPLDGAHEIQSFCLGHTEFVSCLAFICTPDSPYGILVSGGGDSNVRIWDIISGSLLDTCEVGAKVGQLESDATEGNCSTVTDICTISDCTIVAVAIQSLRGIMLLNCDLPSRTLSIAKVVSIVGENFVPTCLASSISGGLLWMVTGASKLRGSDVSSLSRVKVISGFKKSSPEASEQEQVVLADREIPGGDKLLEKLQGSISIDEKVFMAAADAVKAAMSLHRTSFCFVCSHLTSGQKEGDELRRNSDVMEILKKTRFPRVHGTRYDSSPQTILEHDRVIWLGDLNYRIALSYRSAKALVEMRNWKLLLENDQLRIEQRHGRVFEGWNEGRIHFPPTYKYSNNSDRYAGEDKRPKEKRRTPAWCDRILWHGRGLYQLSYVRGESKFSDHRPVYSVFSAEVESLNCSRIRKNLSCSSARVEVEELLPQSHGYTQLSFF